MVGWLAGLATVSAAEMGWSVEMGAAGVAVKGIRTHEVPSRKIGRNDRPQVPAGYLRVARALGERWSVGAGYTRYGTLRASGASANGDIFDRGGVVTQAVVPLEMNERVQEFTLDGRGRWQWSKRWAIEAGPVVSLFRSEAELGSVRFQMSSPSGPAQKVFFPIARYDGTDLRLGGVLAAEFTLAEKWVVRTGYRYAAPPDRTLHVVSLGLARRF